MALRCRLTVTGTGLTNADAAHSISLQGPGAVGSGASQGYALTYGNGYSWINRLTLYGANSAKLWRKKQPVMVC